MLRKSKVVVGLVAAASLFMVPSAFAAAYSSAGGQIILGAGGENYKIIGLSKGVLVEYFNPGTTTTGAQWYTVASAHSGGNTAFGTAQNLTNIMKKDFSAGIPEADLREILKGVPQESTSSQDWGDNWAAQ